MHPDRRLHTLSGRGVLSRNCPPSEKMPPSPMRGADWKAQKPLGSGRCWEAADGTRTHDLLHGKKNLIRRCTPLFACKLRFSAPEGPRAEYPSIRADSGGFSEPFPNGAPMAGPSAYRAEGPRFDPSTRRRPLGKAMDLDRGSWAVVRAYVRPPCRRSGGRPMCDLGLDLSAVALARTSGAPTGRPARSQRADGRSP